MLARARVSMPGLAGAIAIAFGLVVVAQGGNPQVGTWTLNAAKSQSTSPMPKSRVITVSMAGETMTVKVDEVATDGSPSSWSFMTANDGKEVPVTGSPRMDTAVSTSKSPTTRHTVYRKDGKTVLEVNGVISADGKTMTTTAKGVDATGKPMTSKSVYERK